MDTRTTTAARTFSHIPQAEDLSVESFLDQFENTHGRNLRPRSRRQLRTMIWLLSEFFEDHGVESFATQLVGAP